MKICECGFANQDEAQACVACGMPLDKGVAVLAGTSDAFAASGVSANQTPTSEGEPCANRLPCVYLILENVAQPADIPIVVPVPGGILGRAGDFSPEVFSLRVSGIHAALDFSRGKWLIKHLGRNKSYLVRAGEWIELPCERAVELLPGDQLRLADMLFAVSTSPYDPREANAACASAAADATNMRDQEVAGNAPVGTSSAGCNQGAKDSDQAAELGEEHWVITCPVCGARYEAAAPDARVSECATCLDALDKRRIASVAAKREAGKGPSASEAPARP